MSVEQIRDAYAGVADLYIELFGSSGKVHADATSRPHAAIVAVRS